MPLRHAVVHPVLCVPGRYGHGHDTVRKTEGDGGADLPIRAENDLNGIELS